MRISQQTHSKKIIVIIIVVVTLLAAAVATFLWLNQSSSDTNNSQNNSQTQQDATKDNVPTSSTSDDVDVTENTSEIPLSNDTSISIENLSQVDGSLTYSIKVQGDGDGTCAALFSRADSKPVSQTVKASGNACTGTISEYEFDSLGEWNLTVRYYVNGRQSTATQNITIR